MPPPSPERALTPTIRWDFDYTRDEPPVVQRLAETPRHSTPRPDQNTPSARHRPALETPRPRASSAPPATHPAKRKALHYHPVTEEVTPPLTPPRAQAMEVNTATETVPEIPSETWKESGPWHMARTTESCPWSGHAQQDQTGRNRQDRNCTGTGCPR